MDASLNRKITLRLLPYLFVLYVLSFLDRANLGNAHTSLLEDIHLSEEDYSIGVSVFFIGYILFEIPSNLLLKLTSAPIWFAIIMVSWGIISSCMMFVHDLQSLILVRIFLGVAEAGFVPGVAYYLSLWFTPNERAYRFSLFFSSVSTAGVIAGLAAYGLLQLDGKGSLYGWQWLFLIEGIPSIIFGLGCVFMLPESPAQASWLTPEEKEYAISRISAALNDSDHSHISKTQFIQVLKDIRIWLAAFLNCCQVVNVYSLSFFLPALIQQFGFSELISNLLTVPIHATSIVAIIFNGLHSDRTAERYLHIVIPSAFGLLFWGLEAYSLETEMLPLQYTMVILGASCSVMTVPITVIWPMDFMVGSTTAAVVPAIIIGIGNLGGIIGPQLFGLTYGITSNYTWGVTCMSICSFLSIVFATALWIVDDLFQRKGEYLIQRESKK